MTDALLSASALTPPKPSPFHGLKVLWVKHWTDQLFSFAIERPEDFRFRSGEFVMIGLPGEDGGKPVMRAYSIASPAWAEEIEFFSIKVEDGPLTSRLQKIVAGDTVLMGKKPTGTLVLDA
jgi:ferredoxin--NADP+ reductase